MERIKRHLRSAAGYLLVCAKWLVLAALVGCVVGPLGAAFGLALNWANATRAAQPWLLYLLPAAGLVIVFLYEHLDPDGGGSTNQIFVSVREHKPLTLRTAPLIFASTVMTHLFGGSSGREGAALLLGGSVSGQLGKVLLIDGWGKEKSADQALDFHFEAGRTYKIRIEFVNDRRGARRWLPPSLRLRSWMSAQCSTPHCSPACSRRCWASLSAGRWALRPRPLCCRPGPMQRR